MQLGDPAQKIVDTLREEANKIEKKQADMDVAHAAYQK